MLKKELFYVLGALLGDGCAYHWKKGNTKSLILIGDERLTKKYTEKLSKCSTNNVKNYIDRNKNIWFVRVGNITLYNLFKEIRLDLKKLESLIEKGNYKDNSIEFIEGFFDAEGCVKIIREKVRKTPKICLDIANTNLEILNLIENLIRINLGINSKISKQIDKRKNRKIMYHLRIYKKEDIGKFLKNIKTTKLKPEKIAYVDNWLNNGR
ncbi:MAG: LAGLIDADG family homing endonuclease [Nanoarchaeota archaeon]